MLPIIKEIIDTLVVKENSATVYQLTDSDGKPHGSYDYLF